MALIIDLPQDLENELTTEANLQGLTLQDLTLHLLTRWRVWRNVPKLETETARVDQILEASGQVLMPKPTQQPTNKNRPLPVPITGKPVSEIVIEQRG